MLSFCIFMFRPSSQPASKHTQPHNHSHSERASISFRWYVCVFQVWVQTLFAAVCSFSSKKKNEEKKTLKIHTFFPLFSVRFAFVHSFRNFSCSFFFFFYLLLSTLYIVVAFAILLETCIYCFYRYCLWFRFNSIRFPIVQFFSCCIHRRYSLLHKSGSLLFFYYKFSYKIVEKMCDVFSMMHEDMVKGLPLF